MMLKEQLAHVKQLTLIIARISAPAILRILQVLCSQHQYKVWFIVNILKK